jgi:hypothetical protein
MMYRIIIRPSGINKLTNRVQYRVVGCYETVSEREFKSGNTIAFLSNKEQRKGRFY